MKPNDIKNNLVEIITEAFGNNTPIYINAGGSKQFYGEQCDAELLDVTAHTGITDYDPSELVITARAGTLLSEIEATLAENNQMLAFEPPRFAPTSTLGGTIASGLSGPRRAYTGSVRDSVLGISCINGQGEYLEFGGQVMKNVAGYDVSRLMCGAHGTLGLITEISLKVLPQPQTEMTLQFECDATEFLSLIAERATKPIPVSGCCHLNGVMYTRLSDSSHSVSAAKDKLQGDLMNDSDAQVFWQQLRDQKLDFYNTHAPIWRLSLPADTLRLQLEGDTLYDWGGAQRWLASNDSADIIRSLCDNHNGHATLFRNNPGNTDVFHPLNNGIAAIHKKLKQAFDPAGILNLGRMYKEL